MNNKEIIENNKLIAKFMEFTIIDKRPKNKEYNLPDPYNRLIPEIEMDKYTDPYLDFAITEYLYDLKFHESWDWLVPVCKKIQKTIIEPNDSKYHSVYPYMKLKPLFKLRCIMFNIDLLYESVIELIKWYNEEIYKRSL